MTYDAPETTASSSTDDSQHYLALFYGEAPTFVPLSCDNQAELPYDVTGLVYVVVTTSSEGPVTDLTTLAGPALLFFPDSDSDD